MDNNEILTKDEVKKFKEMTRKDYGVKLTNKQEVVNQLPKSENLSSHKAF